MKYDKMLIKWLIITVVYVMYIFAISLPIVGETSTIKFFSLNDVLQFVSFCYLNFTLGAIVGIIIIN